MSEDFNYIKMTKGEKNGIRNWWFIWINHTDI